MSHKPAALLSVLLLVLVGSIAGLQRAALKEQKGAETGVSVAELLPARQAVGARALYGNDPATTRTAWLNVQKTAVGPVQQMRLVPVAGELLGAQAARDQLARVQPIPETAMDGDRTLLARLYADPPTPLTPEESARLRAHHGWFADLALAYGLPDGAPARRAALRPAYRTAGAMIGLFVLGSGALLLGAGLLVVAALRVTRGITVPAYAAAPRPRHDTAFLETVILALAAFPALAYLAGRLPAAAGPFLQAAPLLSLFWLRHRVGGWSAALTALGWIRGKGIVHEAACGIAGYLAGLPLLGCGLVITMLLVALSGADPSHPVVASLHERGPWYVAGLFALACVGAPLVEETVFRGALFHHLRGRLRFPAAALIQGIAFAAVHPQGWTAIPILTAVAVVVAGIREWRGSLIASMTAHALNNALALTAVLLLVW